MAENTTRDITAFLRERVVPARASRHGLVIGIETYRDSRLNLRCAAADAKAIYDLMVDPDCGMFPKDHVKLLLNAEATRESIWRALSSLRREAGENDTVWVYYAGHAAPEESNIYWVTYDADVDDLYGTGLSSDQISRALNDIHAKRLLVLLDCCHAAASAIQKNPTRAVLTAEEVFTCYKGYGRIAISSSDGKEKSVELSEVGHGAFTYFLEKGLRGEADRSSDGVVTADELWDYLHSRVAKSSRKAGNPQTPMLIGEMTHDLALSLNPIASQHKRRVADAIIALIGLGEDHLTTNEAQHCLEILRNGPKSVAQSAIAAEFGRIVNGHASICTLKALISGDLLQPSDHSDSVQERRRRKAPLLAQEVAVDKRSRKSVSRKVGLAAWLRGLRTLVYVLALILIIPGVIGLLVYRAAQLELRRATEAANRGDAWSTLDFTKEYPRNTSFSRLHQQALQIARPRLEEEAKDALAKGDYLYAAKICRLYGNDTPFNRLSQDARKIAMEAAQLAAEKGDVVLTERMLTVFVDDKEFEDLLQKANSIRTAAVYKEAETDLSAGDIARVIALSLQYSSDSKFMGLAAQAFESGSTRLVKVREKKQMPQVKRCEVSGRAWHKIYVGDELSEAAEQCRICGRWVQQRESNNFEGKYDRAKVWSDRLACCRICADAIEAVRRSAEGAKSDESQRSSDNSSRMNDR